MGRAPQSSRRHFRKSRRWRRSRSARVGFWHVWLCRYDKQMLCNARPSGVITLLFLMALALGLPATSQASRAATSSELEAIKLLLPASADCPKAEISTADPAWGYASFGCAPEGECVSACDGSTFYILHRASSGDWKLAGEMYAIDSCPTVGYTDMSTKAGIDLELCVPTASALAEVAREKIAALYKVAWPKLPARWAACSDGGASGSLGWCEYEVMRGRAFVGASFRLKRTAADLEADRWVVRRYVKTQRPCKIASTAHAGRIDISRRTLTSGGGTPCYSVRADPGLVRAIDRLAATTLPRRFVVTARSPHGAGFGARTIFRCSTTTGGSAHTVSCVNRLAHRFSYSFRITSS